MLLFCVVKLYLLCGQRIPQYNDFENVLQIQLLASSHVLFLNWRFFVPLDTHKWQLYFLKHWLNEAKLRKLFSLQLRMCKHLHIKLLIAKVCWVLFVLRNDHSKKPVHPYPMKWLQLRVITNCKSRKFNSAETLKIKVNCQNGNRLAGRSYFNVQPC